VHNVKNVFVHVTTPHSVLSLRRGAIDKKQQFLLCRFSLLLIYCNVMYPVLSWVQTKKDPTDIITVFFFYQLQTGLTLFLYLFFTSSVALKAKFRSFFFNVASSSWDRTERIIVRSCQILFGLHSHAQIALKFCANLVVKKACFPSPPSLCSSIDHAPVICHNSINQVILLGNTLLSNCERAGCTKQIWRTVSTHSRLAYILYLTLVKTVIFKVTSNERTGR
jgi:hypothetical protein